MPTRRATLLMPLAMAACGGPEPVELPPGPIGFAYLTPLTLNVQAIDIAPEDPPVVSADVGPRLSVRPAEAVRIMARDRLFAVGTEARARFRVTQASVVQGRETLTCQLACRLDIIAAEETPAAFVQAQARRVVTGREAGRPRADELLLRQALDALNVEFEFQLRRNLRDWLSTTTPSQGEALPAPVEREDLPRE